jgi:hypothetical protein
VETNAEVKKDSETIDIAHLPLHIDSTNYLIHPIGNYQIEKSSLIIIVEMELILEAQVVTRHIITMNINLLVICLILSFNKLILMN